MKRHKECICLLYTSDDNRFKDDRDETIKRVHEKGVAPIINVGASIGSTMTTMELAKKYDFIYAAVGVHPSDIADLNEETFAWLREQTAWERTCLLYTSYAHLSVFQCHTQE